MDRTQEYVLYLHSDEEEEYPAAKVVEEWEQEYSMDWSLRISGGTDAYG